MLEESVGLRELGFAVHWLKPRSKQPAAGNGWQDLPVASVEALRKSFRKGMNVGIRLGQVCRMFDLYLHVIDVDIRDPSKADEAMAALLRMFPGILLFPTVKSGSGGPSRHYYFLTQKPFPRKLLAKSATFTKRMDEKKGRLVKHNDWEIDLLGTGRQVAAPPSIHPDTGNPYVWEIPFDTQDLEDGLGGPIISAAKLEPYFRTEERAPRPADDDEDAEDAYTIEQMEELLAVLSIEDYLEDHDGWLSVMMAMHWEFEADDEAFELFCKWSAQSSKFDRKETRARWKSLKVNAANPITLGSLIQVARSLQDAAGDEHIDLTDYDDDEIGISQKEVEVEASVVEDEDEELFGTIKSKTIQNKKAQVEADLAPEIVRSPIIQEMNRNHAVAIVKGKAVILTFDHEDGSVDYSSLTDLKIRYANRIHTTKPKTGVSLKPKAMTYADYWMEHSQRRQYLRGVTFAPNRNPKDTYNLWQGFSVEPDPTKSCELYLGHLRDVVCSGVKEHYDYLIGWLAHMIQFPEEKPGVAIVVRGRKGAGKDTVGDYVSALFKNHAITVAQESHFTGRFNAHQEKVLLVKVEEAIWAGNKATESVLKNLITSETVAIERKGIDIIHMPSVLRVFMSSNENWVVPVTADERRFFVLEISEARRGDHEYFRRIRHERDNGGAEALLHFLQTYDLSSFNVRRYPDTAAIGQQKLQSMRNVESWWYDKISTGDIDMPSTVDQEGEGWETSYLNVQFNDMWESYQSWFRNVRYHGQMEKQVAFAKLMLRICPSIVKKRYREKGQQTNTYVVPPLAVARDEFSAFIGSRIEWEDSI